MMSAISVRLCIALIGAGCLADMDGKAVPQARILNRRF